MERNPMISFHSTLTKVMQDRQTQQPKILIASAKNFASTSRGNKSPMKFDSWAQTTNEDIPLQDQKPQSQLEKYLFQKLQEALRKNADFTSKVHKLQQPQQQLQPQPLQLPQQIQQPQQKLQQRQQQLRLQQPREQHQMPQYQMHTITSATSPQLSAPRNLHISSVINAAVQATTERSMEQPSSSTFNAENSSECSSSALVSSTLVMEQPNFAATTANGRGSGRGCAPDIRRIPANWKTKKQLAVLRSVSKSSDALVSIGPNNTCIPVSVHEQIKWESASISTRQLLCAVYGREKLSTHTMTGKKSPAFNDKPRKNALDPLPIEDIIFAVTNKCNVSKNVVRKYITTKCADESKRLKAQLKQMQLINDQQNANNEN